MAAPPADDAGGAEGNVADDETADDAEEEIEVEADADEDPKKIST